MEGLLILILIAVGKGVNMWVVEESFVAITPGETLWELQHKTTRK